MTLAEAVNNYQASKKFLHEAELARAESYGVYTTALSRVAEARHRLKHDTEVLLREAVDHTDILDTMADFIRRMS